MPCRLHLSIAKSNSVAFIEEIYLQEGRSVQLLYREGREFVYEVIFFRTVGEGVFILTNCTGIIYIIYLQIFFQQTQIQTQTITTNLLCISCAFLEYCELKYPSNWIC